MFGVGVMNCLRVGSRKLHLRAGGEIIDVVEKFFQFRPRNANRISKLVMAKPFRISLSTLRSRSLSDELDYNDWDAQHSPILSC
jgi:hypothetical protein